MQFYCFYQIPEYMASFQEISDFYVRLIPYYQKKLGRCRWGGGHKGNSYKNVIGFNLGYRL